jgi:hypothetical protein
MADWYRHVSIGSDGRLCQWANTVENGVMHVRVYGTPTESRVLRRGRDTDTVTLSLNNRSTTLGGRVKGNFPAAFSRDGAKAYVQHDEGGGRTSLRVYDAATGEQLEVRWDAPYAAEGIWDVLDDGTVVLMNDPSRFRRIPNGEFWHNCVETEHYVVGQFGRDPDYGGSLSRLDKRTGKVTRWLGYTPHPPFAVEVDGVLHVAISGRDTPAPDEVAWVDDFPPAPVVEAPQPTEVAGYQLAVPAALPSAWYWHQCDRAVGALPPGNAAWSEAPAVLGDTRPVYECQSGWPIAPARTLVAGAWSTEKAAGGLDGLRREVAAVKLKMAVPAVYLHCDDAAHAGELWEAMRACEEAGVFGVPGVHVTGAGFPAALADECRARYGRFGLSLAWHFGWTEAGYTFTGPQLAEAHGQALAYHAAHKALVLSCFGWDRPGGRLHCPALADAAYAVQAVLGGAPAALGATPAPPPGTTPAGATPRPGGGQQPGRPGGGDTGRNVAIGAAVGTGLAALLGWLKARRKKPKGE